VADKNSKDDRNGSNEAEERRKALEKWQKGKEKPPPPEKGK
jgi:hypothetical protein